MPHSTHSNIDSRGWPATASDEIRKLYQERPKLQCNSRYPNTKSATDSIESHNNLAKQEICLTFRGGRQVDHSITLHHLTVMNSRQYVVTWKKIKAFLEKVGVVALKVAEITRNKWKRPTNRLHYHIFVVGCWTEIQLRTLFRECCLASGLEATDFRVDYAPVANFIGFLCYALKYKRPERIILFEKHTGIRKIEPIGAWYCDHKGHKISRTRAWKDVIEEQKAKNHRQSISPKILFSQPNDNLPQATMTAQSVSELSTVHPPASDQSAFNPSTPEQTMTNQPNPIHSPVSESPIPPNVKSNSIQGLPEGTKFKINQEYKALLSPLTDDELDLLEKNIVEVGVIHPILVGIDGTVYDGHNRFKICRKHRIPIKYKIIDLGDDESIKLWIVEQQLGRRNLSDFQRIEYALKYKAVIAAKAKENQRASGGAVREKSTKPVNTRDAIAQMAGVSNNTVNKVEYIEKFADEETKEQLRRGDKSASINKVHKKLKAEQTDKTHEKHQTTTKTRKADSATNADADASREESPQSSINNRKTAKSVRVSDISWDALQQMPALKKIEWFDGKLRQLRAVLTPEERRHMNRTLKQILETRPEET